MSPHKIERSQLNLIVSVHVTANVKFLDFLELRRQIGVIKFTLTGIEKLRTVLSLSFLSTFSNSKGFSTKKRSEESMQKYML